MTAGTGGEKKADGVGRAHFRASHADRELVIATLKAAFVQGMLDMDEFVQRVGQTLGSRTYAELAALTADLPAGIAAAQLARAPARACDPKPVKAAKAAICVGIALALLAAAVFTGPGNGPERLIGLALFFLPLCGLSLGGLLMFHAWLEKHSRGQLPKGPASGATGRVSQRTEPVTGAGPQQQIDPASPHITEAAPRRLPRPAVARLVTITSAAP